MTDDSKWARWQRANELAEVYDAAELTETFADILARFPPGWFLGITAPSGWWDIIAALNEQLRILDPDYEVHQVKEKFGGLRYYVGAATPEMRDLIRQAEWESFQTCQNCGSKTDVQTGGQGWIYTFCLDCRGYPLPPEDGTWEDTYDSEYNVFYAVGGEIWRNVHSADKCAGEDCVIHNPSDHHMREWRMHLRETALVERICEHGIGHPDPDSWPAMDKITGQEVGTWSVHGCDGCCMPPLVGETWIIKAGRRY